jgi:hypothetical protein
VSPWEHLICEDCWKSKNAGVEPIRSLTVPAGNCCFCLAKTNSQILVRRDPRTTLCRGSHADTLQGEGASV